MPPDIEVKSLLDITILLDYRIEITIDNNPRTVTVYGLLEGFSYSYNNGILTISGNPKRLLKNKTWLITAINDSGTSTQEILYNVIPNVPEVRTTGIATQTVYYGAPISVRVPILHKPSKVAVDGLLTGLRYAIGQDSVNIVGTVSPDADFTIASGQWGINASNTSGSDSGNVLYNLNVGRLPSIPRNLRGRSGDGTIFVSWSSPSDLGIPALTHYEYRYRRTTESNYNEWQSTGSISTTIDITSLINGSFYNIQIRAVNPVGKGPEEEVTQQTGTVPTVGFLGGRSLNVGTSFSTSVSYSGIPTPNVSVTGLPSGLNYSASGGTVTISGSPRFTGSSTVRISVSNTVGSDSTSGRFVVSQAFARPLISPRPTALDAFAFTNYSYNFSVSGYPPPNFSSSTLPSDLTLSSSGRLSGYLSGSGITFFSISATNSRGTDTIFITFTAGVATVLSGYSGANLAPGQSYSVDLGYFGFPTPRFSTSGFPTSSVSRTVFANVLRLSWQTTNTPGTYFSNVSATNDFGTDSSSATYYVVSPRTTPGSPRSVGIEVIPSYDALGVFLGDLIIFSWSPPLNTGGGLDGYGYYFDITTSAGVIWFVSNNTTTATSYSVTLGGAGLLSGWSVFGSVNAYNTGGVSGSVSVSYNA